MTTIFSRIKFSPWQVVATVAFVVISVIAQKEYLESSDRSNLGNMDKPFDNPVHAHPPFHRNPNKDKQGVFLMLQKQGPVTRKMPFSTVHQGS
jgi:hypothetical protein